VNRRDVLRDLTGLLKAIHAGEPFYATGPAPTRPWQRQQGFILSGDHDHSRCCAREVVTFTIDGETYDQWKALAEHVGGTPAEIVREVTRVAVEGHYVSDEALADLAFGVANWRGLST
jgi:predicted DNA-binding protein